ncbi:Lsr2 family DNA-binding protein [Prescottella equi]
MRTSNGASTHQFREWANANGFTVSARGRIAGTSWGPTAAR